MNKPLDNTDTESKGPFTIAAIGASAGGLEAITEVLNNINEQTGIAFVYIQHLDPMHDSNLSAILSRQTKMPVLEAVDRVKIEPDHVYIIPPNKEMSIDDGMLSISPRPTSPYSHMPINRFFISLSETHKEAAIGIVLSGTATDGTLGLKAIKAEGGITMVQNESAKFQSMPQNAIHEGVVDLVLSAKQIGEELVRLSKHRNEFAAEIKKVITEDDKEEKVEVSSILQLIRDSLNVDFTHYKITTIRRRIIRRMMLHELETLKEYLQYIVEHPDEVKLLYQDLLINVTGFFRDKESCNYLLKEILPKLFKSRRNNQPVRIWVPACSTGQEAYTVAMIIKEHMGQESNVPVQIFATDLSESAINKARLGIYKAEEVAEVPEKQLELFFKKVDGNYRIIKSLREMCIFATHNVLNDPPFSRLDIISCCNLLIYINNNLQRKILSSFHYSLNPGGYLILGKSESVKSASNLFYQTDKKLKLYTKKNEISRPQLDFSFKIDRPIYPEKSAGKQKGLPDISLEKNVQDLLLKRFTPASVVVNADLDILQFHGSTGLYLEAAPGKASLNLLKMARSPLAFEVRNLIHKTKKSGESEKKTGIDIIVNDKQHRVSVEALFISHENTEEYYLLVFEEETISDTEKDYATIKNERVQQLELQLKAVRDDIRLLVEAQEASTEELQSANEEIVSSNEELQSINEELETSREEIESSNEELMTMNQELQVRNGLLAESQEYSDAILSTLREAIIILDYDYRIKSVNQSFLKTFHLVDTEIAGKVLTEISNNLWDIPELKVLLDEIVRKNKEFRDFEVNAKLGDGNSRKLLLNARKIVQKIHGEQLILLAVENITGINGI